MRNPFLRALQPPTQRQVCYLVPVTITATSPLTVTLNGATGLAASKIIPSGAYVTGLATCLMTHPGPLLVLPNG